MRHLLPALTLLPILTSSLPTTRELAPLPLVIWHGLGDDFQRDGMRSVAALADATNPGTYVHLIHLASSGAGDRQASFLGDVNAQVDQVCAQLHADNILRTAPGINALGFSQGGQFLRAYIERCNDPPVHNLVTLGSQHNGIAEFQACGASDYLCRGGEALLRWGRWSKFVQERLVPAQYFRDPTELEAYLEHSNFLADVNNERGVKNATYKENLARVNRFAMYLFEEDQMVHPKESAWFAEVNATSGEVTPLREREIYKQDWLGLRELDEKGALEFKTVPGPHMHLSEEVLTKLFTEYFAPVEVDVIASEREGLWVQAKDVTNPLVQQVGY
ncbi:alpha/beta-hydrolase [Aspergillus steynii IBT 23096]|uniref:Palmitoyl-protein thioesterase 1 n=1 Tax=Aspergillus steynii IBT 23096 TaxID=1392250 RepID=A0A2I2GKJ2_9EURO|nr:alpha/beta-hydrolase [Aspergillus steynii IBT 23096]PLB53403.1 alpha/beta-hydrolase [Aspergillus steynii IBT 23096]